MRGLVLTVAALAIAAPAAAIIAKPTLPVAPRGMEYVQTSCFGDVYGRETATRVQADGLVLRMPYRSYKVVSMRVKPAQAMKVIRSVRLDPRPLRPKNQPVCWLMRVQKGRTYSVLVPIAPGATPQVRALQQVVADMKALGDRATTPYVAPPQALSNGRTK